tara:strand:+ start:115 stop:276 length:162 start_codon:yes stop_codon:yes gene_type:complete
MPKHSNKEMDKPKAKSKKGGNPWMAHVAKVRSKNKGKTLKQILVLAKKSYKKK